MATAVERRPLTPEQQDAVSTRNVSVALSAGAGCGKTFVLTERFLSHLEPHEGTDASAQLGKLIAITFTDRAAREMRDRIRGSVRERLRNAPAGAAADHWLQILRRLDSAKISTIHSFCGSLLRSHAVEAGLDPQFGLLEPVQADTLLGELIDDRLRQLLADHDEAMIELTAAYDLRGVREKVATLVGERFTLRFEEWLDHTPIELAELWGKYHAEQVRPRMLAKFRAAPVTGRLRKLIAESPAPQQVLLERATEVEELLQALDRALEVADGAPAAGGNSEAAILDRLREVAVVKGCSVKNKVWVGQEGVYEQYRDDFKELRELIDDLRDHWSFDTAAALPTAEAALRLTAIAAPVRMAYEEEKKQLNVLDFDDLLLRARDLLCKPEHARLRKNYSRGIELLLVDECQDTDALQVELIQALVDGELAKGKLFFVGDFKQSIYRFRGAEPKVFSAMQNDVPAAGRLPLSLNFRSQPAILDFVNTLFCDYFGDRYEPLDPRREQTSPVPAIEFLWASTHAAAPPTVEQENADANAEPAAPPAEDAGGERGADALRKLEADWIARRLRAMFDAPEAILPAKSKGGSVPLRRPEYGDAAILFRALSNVALYEAALEQYGIPYYVVGGKAFYSQQEVYDLLNFLRVLDSVCDDVALAGVLRSPFFSLDDEALFLLADRGARMSSSSEGLAAGFFAPALADDLAASLGEERSRRVEFARRTLTELRGLKNRLPIAELLNEILARTAYDAVLTSEFLGERKLANLRKLLALARSFDRSGIFTLTEFIAQLSESVSNRPDEALAATYAEGANVVRLMTIHQSKGLEFPIVVVPDLERRKQPDRAGIAFHPDLGPMVKPPYGDDLPSGLDLYRFIEQEQSEAESKRLLYVAVTRAADYLMLSSGVQDAAVGREEWRKFIGERYDLATGKFLGTLGPGARRAEVRVTTTRPELPGKPKERAARADWPKVLANAAKQAAGKSATLRPGTEAVAPRLASRRRFSFTRLNGELLPVGSSEVGHELVESAVALDGAAGASLGKLVHGVLATIDFRRLGQTPARGELERHVRRQARLLDVEDDQEIATAIGMVGDFLRTPRGQAIAAAKQVHREIEFMMRWPTDSTATQTTTDDEIYLQGFIDLLYEDAAGAWHLVDYKTHQLATTDPVAAAAPYVAQLSIYAIAVERILGRVPDELALHFMRTGGEHAVAWSEAARAAATASVNQALRKTLLPDEPHEKPNTGPSDRLKKPRAQKSSR
ncbi:MAG: UvrD-helicase domain-containing protein [Planctomycetia bacterium]|nr:UvrD-helicase domain-containing protein [Planctomycetia bacterium]